MMPHILCQCRNDVQYGQIRHLQDESQNSRNVTEHGFLISKQSHSNADCGLWWWISSPSCILQLFPRASMSLNLFKRQLGPLVGPIMKQFVIRLELRREGAMSKGECLIPDRFDQGLRVYSLYGQSVGHVVNGFKSC